MTVTIYSNPLSQPGRAVVLYAKLINAPVEIVNVDVLKGETKKEEYANKFWTQKIPALEDGDFRLVESAAIIDYLGKKFNAPEHLNPTDLQQQALVNEYLHWHHTGLHNGASGWFRAKYAGPLFFNKQFTETAIEQAWNDLQAVSKRLDSRLKDRKFLVGEVLSAADIQAVNEYTSIVETEVYDLTEFPHLQEWYNRTRDALQPHFDEQHEAIRGLKETLKKA